ncbi:MAG TPA: hypothetical protein QF764_11040 [Planctomycetota bacterium]|jgi:hypothetical protein|nr:hypothetical protein [Planctomycetota bacterium]
MSRSFGPVRQAIIGIWALVVLSGCGGIAGPTALDKAQATASRLEDEWGVEVLGIRRIAAGYMLDFRFRVLDAEKAAPILDRRIPAHVKVTETGTRLLVPQAPKLGSMRQTTFDVKTDRNYFIVFANPSQTVRVGDEVSVVVGDFQTGDMTVQ